jgi:hypothetical protein
MDAKYKNGDKEKGLVTRRLWIACLCLVLAPVGWAKNEFVTGFIQIFPDGQTRMAERLAKAR